MSAAPDALVVRKLFDDAVGLPPEQRDAFLDAHAPNPEVRQRVERLLRADAARAAATPRWSPPADGGPLAPPGFEVLAKLGEGGFGVVYKARQLALNRVVALKTPWADRVTSAGTRQRFKVEAEAAARLRHPNVVSIHDVGEHDGRPFLVLEFVDGGSLADRLNGQPWSPDAAAALMETLARAVHEAHRLGIVHRDLKPANVLLASDGATPKVADFGIAKLLDAPRQTATGSPLGTPNYMAPEQAAGAGDRVGPAADVYALGATLYELLTGRPPFAGETPWETIRRVMTDEPVPPRRLRPKVPRDLETVCLGCLRKEPGRRYAGAAALADDLRLFLDRRPVRIRPVGPLARLGMWGRRHPGLAVGFGMAAAALIAVALISLRFGIVQRRLAADLTVAAAENHRQVALATWALGRRLCDDGDTGAGLVLMAEAMRKAPAGPPGDAVRDAIRADLSGWLPYHPTLHAVWGHGSVVRAVAVSPDGKTAATGADDGTVRLWDLAAGPSGDCRRSVPAHAGPVRAVAFATTGGRLLSGGDDGVIRVWDTTTRAMTAELPGRHAGGVFAIARSADGQRVATAGADGRVRLYESPSFTPRDVLDHRAVRALAFQPDGRALFAGDDGGVGLIYNLGATAAGSSLVSGKPTRRAFEKGVLSAAFAGGGASLLVGTAGWELLALDAKGLRQSGPFDTFQGRVVAIAVAPDDRALAVIGAADSGVARVWAGGPTPAGMARPPLGPALRHPRPMTAAAFGPGGTFLTACEDGFVRVWRAATAPAVTALPHHPRRDSESADEKPFMVQAVALRPGGELAATAGRDGIVKLWTLPGGAADGQFAHDKRVTSVAFTPDGRTLVSGCMDGYVRFWDLATRRLDGPPVRPPGREGVSWLTPFPDGGRIVVACADGSVQCWDAATRAPAGPRVPSAGGSGQTVVAATADGTRLAVAGESGPARLCDGDGTLVQELRHQNKVYGIAFSPDGSRVATASLDGRACVWCARTGELRATLPHAKHVNAVAFAPDGRLVLTGGDEGAQFWDVAHQRRVGPKLRYRNEVMHVALSADAKVALLADWLGYGVAWQLPPAVEGDAETVARRVRAATGLTLDAAGGWQALDGREWLTLRDQPGPP